MVREINKSIVEKARELYKFKVKADNDLCLYYHWLTAGEEELNKLVNRAKHNK